MFDALLVGDWNKEKALFVLFFLFFLILLYVLPHFIFFMKMRRHIKGVTTATVRDTILNTFLIFFACGGFLLFLSFGFPKIILRVSALVLGLYCLLPLLISKDHVVKISIVDRILKSSPPEFGLWGATANTWRDLEVELTNKLLGKILFVYPRRFLLIWIAGLMLVGGLVMLYNWVITT